MLLGVNIDHVATLRQARKERFPDPIHTALIAEESGADGITCHLREDRRHIQDRDVELLRELIKTRLNLEMSINKDIVDFACRIKPDQSTLVPERREEITTEGGLDVLKNFNVIRDVINELKDNRIKVSLFIDAEKEQIEAAKKVGADAIEIHTGGYANSKGDSLIYELDKIKTSAAYAKKLGLNVFAGHGLDYHNVIPIKEIKEIEELNIGFSIVARALIVGFERAVNEMKALIKRG